MRGRKRERKKDRERERERKREKSGAMSCGLTPTMAGRQALLLRYSVRQKCLLPTNYS
jgi:hypothetical protein